MQVFSTFPPDTTQRGHPSRPLSSSQEAVYRSQFTQDFRTRRLYPCTRRVYTDAAVWGRVCRRGPCLNALRNVCADSVVVFYDEFLYMQIRQPAW